MNALEAEETEKCITTRIAAFAMRFQKGNTTSFFPHEKIISTMKMKNRRFCEHSKSQIRNNDFCFKRNL